jgi:adenylate cyclase
MTMEGVKRKLTAILSADVKGYSRLMREDEVATVDTLKAYREAMSALIQKYRGRVVDTPGDNLLAEFGSVVDAVQCAVEVQQELKARNAQLPENRRMEFRIGVNLGDVIEEEEQIYGDGVNVAARVEGLADAGGICISGTAFDQVRNKLSVGYEYLGEQTVKNIPEPVRVYRILMEPEAAGKVIGEKRPGLTRGQRVALAAALIVVVAALATWYFHFRPSPMEVASEEKMVFPLPEKPSIAVLAFDNLTGDPQQEYFSDGMTEEIITALSKVPYLFVIARNSTFSYKGKPVKIHQVAEELGVRYVLEGSVRRAGDRVRVTAQLIDAITGHHLWAERYDRDLKDIFALQDEITKMIITALQVKLTEREEARLLARGTDNLEAYLEFLQGREYLLRFNKEANALARKKLEEVIALDPEYAEAYRFLAATHIMDVWLRASKSPRQSLAQAIELAQKTIALEESSAGAHGLLSHVFMMQRKYEKAIAEGERAITLDPNSADAHNLFGMTLRFAGKPQEAIPVIKKSIRLNPFCPGHYFYNLGIAYVFTGRCEEAVSACKKAIQRSPKSILAHIAMTGVYGICGLEEEARAAGAELLQIAPKFSVDYFAKTLTYKNQADKERLIEALRKSGLK